MKIPFKIAVLFFLSTYVGVNYAKLGPPIINLSGQTLNYRLLTSCFDPRPAGKIDYAEAWINLNEPSNIVSRTTPFVQMKLNPVGFPDILGCLDYINWSFHSNDPLVISDSQGRDAFNGNLVAYQPIGGGTIRYVVKSQVSGWRAITCSRVELGLPRMDGWDFNILFLWGQPTLQNMSTILSLFGQDLTPEKIANSTCAVVKEIISLIPEDEQKSSLQQVTPAQIVKIIQQSDRGKKQW